MFDFLFSLVGFVFRNFFLIVGLSVLAIIVHNILTQNKKDATLHKMPALVLLFGFILHSILYWTLSDDVDLLVYASTCILPAFVAWCIGGGVHEADPGSLRELITIVISYIVSYLVAVIFKSWIVKVLTIVVAVILGKVVLTNLGKQQLMDMESQNIYGDSETVQELYREGYRPTDYYNTDKKGQTARSNLRRHVPDDV